MFNKELESAWTYEKICALLKKIFNDDNYFSRAEKIAIFRILESYEHALKKHKRGFHSSHEGYAVILEELDEAWDAIKVNDSDHANHEISQVGAMTMRYLVDLQDEVLLEE